MRKKKGGGSYLGKILNFQFIPTSSWCQNAKPRNDKNIPQTHEKNKQMCTQGTFPYPKPMRFLQKNKWITTNLNTNTAKHKQAADQKTS